MRDAKLFSLLLHVTLPTQVIMQDLVELLQSDSGGNEIRTKFKLYVSTSLIIRQEE